MNNKSMILKMRLDKPGNNIDNIRFLIVNLPSDYSDIDIDSDNQRAVLNGICQGFGFLFGGLGASLIEARITDSLMFPAIEEDDECEMYRVSGLISED